MVTVIKNSWLKFFNDELQGTKTVLLISPFVSENIVDELLSKKDNSTIKLITRFNLNDMRAGVTSLGALKQLVEAGVQIKGIIGLHSKVFIFDRKSVIVGSANFTSGGFFNNYEYGLLCDDVNVVNESETYFQSLWDISINTLTLELIEEWRSILLNSNGTKKQRNECLLPDFGVKATLFTKSKHSQLKYFVKFFGKSDFRVNLDYTSTQEIERSHCHWAITFSGRRGRYKKGRPRKYNDGDIVYFAQMLEGNDYAIFGKGIAMKHVDTVDVASDEDVKNIHWKKDWPIYIRVYDVEFIDSSMRNCPKLSTLMSQMKYESFRSTFDRYKNGEEIINPRDSLKQQADIELTALAAEWLENQFQKAKRTHGAVSQIYLRELYQGVPTINEILKERG